MFYNALIVFLKYYNEIFLTICHVVWFITLIKYEIKPEE